MFIKRPWAFWRRTQYLIVLFVFFSFIGTGVYFGYFYEAANCFDNTQNGDERGIDCGGSCVRICAFDVTPVRQVWANVFRVTEGQYNAVAYIENTNIGVGSPEVRYTFTLLDRDGIITERSGLTILPPDSVYPIFEGRIDTGSRVPTETILQLEEPELWLPADIGREQFIVENRVLTDIENSPRLEAEVTNTELTEAQDVEIVATIFDSGGNALTSSRTFVPLFPGRSTEDIVFTWPEPIAKTIRSCAVPTDVVLAIDLSGSMNDDSDDPPEPVTSVLRAAEAFALRLGDNDQVSIVTYASDAAVPQPLTDDKAQAREEISSLSIAPEEETGSTNTGSAIIAATEELSSERQNPDARKVLVLLTDGLANAPGQGQEPEEYARGAATDLKGADTEIFTIGLGSQLNESFLREVATGESYYFNAPTAATVNRIYESVTAAICEDGPAVIEIIPKTETSFTPLR